MVESPSYPIILQTVRNKITGLASQSLTTHNIKSEWSNIRAHLIATYADTRSVENLQLELFSLIKQTLEPYKLFEKIQSILTLLSNKIQTQGLDQKTTDLLIGQHQATGLTVFMASLQDPLGSTIRSSKPADLQVAYSLVQQEQSIQRLKQISKQKPRFNQKFSRPPLPAKQFDRKLDNNIKQETDRSYHPQYKQPYRSQKFVPRTFIKQENLNNIESECQNEDFIDDASHLTSIT